MVAFTAAFDMSLQSQQLHTANCAQTVTQDRRCEGMLDMVCSVQTYTYDSHICSWLLSWKEC